MKLRTKLLLGVGLLLFAMVIVMYILPAFLVRKDVYKAADQIHTLLIDEHQRLVGSQNLWLEDELGRLLQNIDSLLFVLYEEPSFSKTLSFSKDNPTVNVWEGVARISGYDPEIGFVQAHAPKTGQTIVVSPHSTELYPIETIQEQDELTILAINPEEENRKQRLFVGVVLPKELQNQDNYTLYALLDVQKVVEQEAELQEVLVDVNPELVKSHLESMKQRVFNQIEKDPTAYLWAIKIDMIRTLAPLILKEFLIEHSEKISVPVGIARLDSSGNGLAILSEEAFQTSPLFDDRDYFETNPPKSGDPPLAQNSVLVPQESGDHVFIGNTLLIDGTFLTIGFPLGHIVRQLSLAADKTVLLHVEERFWLGIDENGKKVPMSTIKKAVAAGLLDHKRGTLAIDGKLFFYGQISTLNKGKLVFYELRPAGGEESIISTLLDLEDKLSRRISWQLSLVALIALILVLLFIGRMGFSVIYPVTKLAKATEDVVAGRYEEVVLPEVGRRRDEVATLTRSFADMVYGLQEREKIRGVLDKVVSKDVADEILRTQIHLGGEDRIVTMLFSDIRDFSEITENVNPQKTIQILNACMTKISRVIEGEGGVIDKYVGDEVMAIFGAPTSHPDHALRAVSTGMLIIETLKRWNQEREKNGEAVIEMGIGVHTGLVVAGNMGAEDRLNYTVLGSSVNLASRLCQVAKPNQLIISEATLSEPNVEESFFVKPLQPIVLKGFSAPVSIYEGVSFKSEGS